MTPYQKRLNKYSRRTADEMQLRNYSHDSMIVLLFAEFASWC